MIVISGALVAVATVLLVVGLASSGLTFVYASIAVSVLAFAALVAGVLQRRGEEVEPETAGVGATGTTSETTSDEGVTAVYSSADRAPAPAAPPVDAAVSGDVLVVPGRPRYHVGGCRYLANKDVEALPVGEARSEGFTACGVCRPDEALAASPSAAVEPLDEPTALEPAPTTAADVVDEPVVDSGVPGAEVDEVAVEEPAPARRRSATAQAAAARKASTAARTRTATAATGGPVTPPAPTPARKAPAKAAAAPSRAATAAAGSKAGKVVVIPERGRYHRGECRYVRGAEGTQEMSATQAKRQGFQACGVCKP